MPGISGMGLIRSAVNFPLFRHDTNSRQFLIPGAGCEPIVPGG